MASPRLTNEAALECTPDGANGCATARLVEPKDTARAVTPAMVAAAPLRKPEWFFLKNDFMRESIWLKQPSRAAS